MGFNKSKVLEDINKLVQKGDYNRAIIEFERLFKIDPKDYKLRQKLGDIYLRVGKKKEAIEQFQLVAEGYVKEGFALKAMAIYRQILRIEPTKYDIYEKLAELYKKQGLLADAITNLRILADAFEKQKKLNEAMQTWEKIISWDPDSIIYRGKLIEFYLKQGLYSRATEKLKQSIDYLKSKGRFDDVESLINKFPGLIEEDKGFGIQIARALYNSGKYAEALARVDTMLASNPNDLESICLKGHCHTALGQLDKAKESFRNALKFNPELIDAKRGLLKVFIKEKNIVDFLVALEDLYRQLMAKKQYDDIKMLLDNFYVHLPNEKKIIKMYVDLFRTTGDINGLIDKLKKLGNLYLEDGNINDAGMCFKEILAIDPYEPHAVEFFEKYMPKEHHEEEKKAESVFVEEIELQEEIIPEINKEIAEVETHLKYGLINKAKEKLEELSNKYLDSPEIKELWLKYFTATKDKEATIMVLRELINIYKAQENIEKVSLYEQKLKEFSIQVIPEKELIEKEASVEDIEVVDEVEIIESEPTVEVSEITEVIEEENFSPNIEEMFLEADFYVKNSLIDDAIKVYESILKIDPENERAKKALNDILNRDKVVQQEKVEEQITEPEQKTGEQYFDISKEIIKEMEQEEALSGLFKSEAEKLTFEELLKEFKSKISQEIEEGDVETHYNLGIAYKEMGLLDEAVQEFILTSRFLNKAYDSYTMIASCLTEKREWEKALEFYKRALHMPDIPKEKMAGTYLEMGYIYENTGDLDNAILCFKKAYDTDNNLTIAKEKVEEIISKNPLSAKVLEEKSL
ncbi:MAG: tetratricopeptide repeat protein [Proteobacteria bacterium]|nr:tetratricopeptide repeat protein [Pseudomonadota bacterium]